MKHDIREMETTEQLYKAIQQNPRFYVNQTGNQNIEVTTIENGPEKVIEPLKLRATELINSNTHTEIKFDNSNFKDKLEKFQPEKVVLFFKQKHKDSGSERNFTPYKRDEGGNEEWFLKMEDEDNWFYNRYRDVKDCRFWYSIPDEEKTVGEGDKK